ncbi:MAG: hypothetical protein ACP5FH_05865 [Terracidiphilus sp.]
MIVLNLILLGGISPCAHAQSPEISMREFSSTQIKKGVRSIGFGGDGATWGNYGLIWHDANGIVADYGETQFTNGNGFHFEAGGMTSPATWHRLTFYAITMVQNGNDIHLNVRSPGLGSGATPITGNASDLGVFGKIALPLGKGVSIGMLLSHETSQFDGAADAAGGGSIRYDTDWRPSGGLGLAWQPDKRLLFGTREMVNNDMEYRTDPAGTMHGEVRSTEFRLGSSMAPWRDAWIDLGGTSLIRSDALAGTHSHFYHPNLGFEQGMLNRHLELRGGLDETSPTAGLSAKYKRLKLDTAYVRNMGRSRVGTLFGAINNSVLLTLTINYGPKRGR